MEDLSIDADNVIEEVSKIFGRNGKTKFKLLAGSRRVYSQVDDLKTDLETLTEKSAFDELLLRENAFFEENAAKPFDPDDVYGEIVFSEFGTLYSKSNLSTVKAVHGVNRDAYQYEVQLKSNGPIRIGWASQNCTFTADRPGVGETINSYSFDGYYLHKWNLSNILPYGKKWRVGNVIGCIINFSKNFIEYFQYSYKNKIFQHPNHLFFGCVFDFVANIIITEINIGRPNLCTFIFLSSNGRSLGIAFEYFNKDGMTYFPALSLSNQERVFVNMGERPFKFPVQGAKPIVVNPTALINCYQRLEPIINSLIDYRISIQSNKKKSPKHESKIVINNVMRTVLFSQIKALLMIPYVISDCLTPFLNDLFKKSPKKIQVLLESMWEIIPESKMIFIMSHLMFDMLCEFQCTWRNKFDISHQIIVLKLITEICQETKTRKQMIVHILFDKIKFAHFLHIIAPSDEMFDHMIPLIYWSIENVDLADNMKTKLLKNFPRDHKNRKTAYNNSCDKIKNLINELIKLQIRFLKILLNDDDQTDTKVSSRILFCRRFQGFVQENMIFWRNDPMLKLPNPVLLSTFFRLSFLVREFYKEELIEEKEIKIHTNVFYLDDYNCSGIERIGGLFSYLRSKYQEIIKSKLGSGYDNDTDGQNDNTSSDAEVEIIEIGSATGLISVLTRLIGNAENRNANTFGAVIDSSRVFSFDHLPTDKMHILSVLLNNIICLYHIAGHRQLVEYVAFKDRLTDLSIDYAVGDYELRMASNENVGHFEQELKELVERIIVSSRHLAWLMSLVFVDVNGDILEWVLRVTSNTIKYCSEMEGELFRLVPEYYVDHLLGLIVLLPDYTNRIHKFENIIIDRELLAVSIGEILLQIFNDNRIIHPKSKETIIQGVILYLTHPKSVKVLQAASEKWRLNAIKSILKPTERFLWIKTNMILMLIWYGSGLAFRYTRPPNLENRQMSINGTIEEIVFSNMGAERPSASVLQNDIKTIIAEDKQMASNFINNSLNYLNWTFSEFISLFQEVKDMNGNDVLTLSSEEATKLKTCGSNFILSVTLLRIIEMLIYFDRNLIIDQEGSLGRVFQLMFQILNRIHSSSSTFQYVQVSSLPFLECVHKFVILVPTIGILLSLLGNEIDEKEESTADKPSTVSSIPEITDALISDPNFNLPSLEFIILPENQDNEPFSLNSYKKYFTEEELEKVTIMYHHLDWYAKRHKSMASSINENDLCLICYSNKCNVTLKPCRHQCCKLCINHHKLYSRVCFYCKRRIELVVDAVNSSTVIHNFGSEPPPL